MTKVLIIGAGMGGLTAALALLAQGVEVEVHEAARELREVGAGLTLSGSSVKSLHALGVLDAVRAVSQVSAAMPFVHYRTAQLLWGRFAEAPPAAGSPEADTPEPPFVSRHIFRADLQAVLARRLDAQHPGTLRLGHALTGFRQDADGVSAFFADGASARGDILIGADGIRSVVRAALFGDDPPAFTGQVAWRFLLDGDQARPHLGSGGPAAVFFGPDCVFNRYLLRRGSLLNCVAIVRTPGWQCEGWSTPGDPQELAALFADWHPDVRALLALARPERLVKWALGSRAPLRTWRSGLSLDTGRVAVLGDAAHPMLPFLGLGAAMAIEDGVVLGRAFALEPSSPLAALARYEAARLPRTTAVADASRRQGEALQAKDPDHFRGDDAPVADRAMFDYDPRTAEV